eukprot:scaffold691_cov181-Ochromonas_danica.AAC.39
MLIELILENEGLGVNLRPILGYRGAYVDSFYRSQYNEILPAERSGTLQIGDVLISIGSLHVLEESIETIQMLLRKMARPLILIFLRSLLLPDSTSSSSKFTLKEMIKSPLNRIWVKKYLRHHRFYHQDQEEWRVFSRLQELSLALTITAPHYQGTKQHHQLGLGRLITSLRGEVSELVSPYLFPLPASLMRLDNNNDNDNENDGGGGGGSSSSSSSSSNDPEDDPVHTLLTILESTCEVLLKRGIENVLEGFLSSDMCHRMYAFYYRSPTFQFLSLQEILQCEMTTFFLYIFLSRYHHHYRLHNWCLDQWPRSSLDEEQRQVGTISLYAYNRVLFSSDLSLCLLIKILSEMLKFGLVNKFYQSELYQLLILSLGPYPQASADLPVSGGSLTLPNMSDKATIAQKLAGASSLLLRYLPKHCSLHFITSPSLHCPPPPACQLLSTHKDVLLSTCFDLTFEGQKISHWNGLEWNLENSLTKIDDKDHDNTDGSDMLSLVRERLGNLVEDFLTYLNTQKEYGSLCAHLFYLVLQYKGQIYTSCVALQQTTTTGLNELKTAVDSLLSEPESSSAKPCKSDADLPSVVTTSSTPPVSSDISWTDHLKTTAMNGSQQFIQSFALRAAKGIQNFSPYNLPFPLSWKTEATEGASSSSTEQIEPNFSNAMQGKGNRFADGVKTHFKGSIVLVPSVSCDIEGIDSSGLITNQHSLDSLRVLATRQFNPSSSSSSSAVAFSEDIRGSMTWEVVLDFLRPFDLHILLHAVLLEARIIILVSDVVDLNLSFLLSNFLQETIQPLQWQHIYAPTIPLITAAQLLACPAPYLLGTTKETFATFLRDLPRGQCIEDAVVVDLTEASSSVSFLGLNKLTAAMTALQCNKDRINVPWLVKKLQEVLEPHLCSWRKLYQVSNVHDDSSGESTVSSSVSSSDLEDLTSRFPMHLLLRPAANVDISGTRVKRVLNICQHYVQCLLSGIRHCCYPGQLPTTIRRNGHRRSADARGKEQMENADSSENDDRDDDREVVSQESVISKEDSSPLETLTFVPSAVEDDRQLIFEDCVLFDEEMFMDLKAAQSLLHPIHSGHRLRFADDFLKAFLRAQCLANFLSLPS